MAQISYDQIVIGLGVMGSAALRALARRGHKVLGIEQHHLGHKLGSSHGHTRLIRHAYFEHPDYVPLLDLAYGEWRALEGETGAHLMDLCGLLVAGQSTDALIAGALRSAATHALRIEELALADAYRQFPGFHYDDDMTLLFDPQGGILRAEPCVAALQESAIRAGATLHPRETVCAIEHDCHGVTITTDRDTYTAGKAILTAGPWTSRLVARLGGHLTVQRIVLTWWKPSRPAYSLAAGTPAFGFMARTGDGTPRFYYGTPTFDALGVKVAEHAGPGQSVVADPDRIDRAVDLVQDVGQLRHFVQHHLPALAPAPHHAEVCMYTNSPDGHFIVDSDREFGTLHFAAGFSGHGFKFAPAIGAALADLAENGATTLPVAFLRADRF